MARYQLAKLIFRLRFPSGNLRECDFRPHLEGHIINISIPILDQPTPQETRELAYRRWAAMFRHVKRIRRLFRPKDGVTLIVGIVDPPHQLLKGCFPVAKLREAQSNDLKAVGGSFVDFMQLE